MLNIFFFK